MPAKSQSQQKAAAIALAAKRGDIPASKLRGASKSMAKMGTKTLRKFAKTKHTGLPKRVQEGYPGMVPCSVDPHYSAWLVTFDDGKTLLLQSDYDQAAFAVACGAISAPQDWDGTPSSLGEDWVSFDPSSISECPDDYYDVDGGEAEMESMANHIVACLLEEESKRSRRVMAYDIDYDTDGETPDLPKKMSFKVDADFDPREELADLVSDKTGWSVNGLKFKWIDLGGSSYPKDPMTRGPVRSASSMGKSAHGRPWGMGTGGKAATAESLLGEAMSFKLARKPETNEWWVKVYVNGVYDEDKSYYTDDEEDAKATLQHMRKIAGLA